jgi:hypothetical protein
MDGGVGSNSCFSISYSKHEVLEDDSESHIMSVALR